MALPAKLGAVAVLIIGQLRGYFASTEMTQHFMIDPLVRDFQTVHVYMCLDAPNAAKMNGKTVGGLTPVFVKEYRSRSMFLRMKECFVDVSKHARATNVRYEWWVRSRPDQIFYSNLPGIRGKRSDTIYARSRRIGPGYADVDNEAVSYWDFGDICGQFPCVRVVRGRSTCASTHPWPPQADHAPTTPLLSRYAAANSAR